MRVKGLWFTARCASGMPYVQSRVNTHWYLLKGFGCKVWGLGSGVWCSGIGVRSWG